MESTASVGTRFHRRRVPEPKWFALALAVGAFGCAPMDAFRRAETPPMLGDRSAQSAPERPIALAADAAPNEKAPSAPTAADSYAAWLERRTPVLHPESARLDPATSLARSTAAPPAPLDSDASLPMNLPSAPSSPSRDAVPALPGTLAVPSTPRNPAEAPAPATAAEGRPTDGLEQLERLLDESQRRLNAMNAYQVSMTRQERVNGTLQDPENVLLSIRRDPKAVRLEWVEGPNKGREVIYNEGGLMHVNMPGTLVPRVSLPANSPIALKNSRHPISEAGFATLVAEVRRSLETYRSGTLANDQLTYRGLASPEPGAPPCHAIVRVTPTGETWTVHIDDRTKLPYMVHAQDASGQVLEHYVFRDVRIDPVELADAAAFDPDARWGKSATGGLFGRLAGAAGTLTPDDTSAR